eukprot:Nitzschia sp. Nitz4//scaffold142_size57810//19360//20250//NITZ4_006493-RA/size57810-processed-gene-0.55-mRNA-1//-1//CDS//3329536382//7144//frame0
MKLSFAAVLALAFGQVSTHANSLRAGSAALSVAEEPVSSTPRVWLTLDDYDLEDLMPQGLGGTKIALSNVLVDEELSHEELGFLVSKMLSSIDMATDSIFRAQDGGDVAAAARSLEEAPEEETLNDANQGSRSLWFWRRKRTSSDAITDVSDAVNPSILIEGLQKITAPPTAAPTAVPTVAPTVAPTRAPVAAPTQAPTNRPTFRDDEFLSKYGVYGNLNDWYDGASHHGYYHCRFCEDDDDYYRRNLKLDKGIQQELESLTNEMFCEALREGPLPVFRSVEVCKVTLPDGSGNED